MQTQRRCQAQRKGETRRKERKNSTMPPYDTVMCKNAGVFNKHISINQSMPSSEKKIRIEKESRNVVVEDKQANRNRDVLRICLGSFLKCVCRKIVILLMVACCRLRSIVVQFLLSVVS